MPAIPPRLLRNGAGGDAVALFGGNLLLGTSGINSANGMLQLPTHTTSAGGLGLGTDLAFHRVDSSSVKLLSGGAVSKLILTGSGGSIDLQVSGTSAYLTTPAGGAFFVRTNGGTIGLTIDSAQNASFVGGVTIQATSAIKGVRTAVAAALDFPSVAANVGTQDLTVTVTGAAVGDAVFLGLPAAPDAGLVWNAFVSAANTVTIRATNISAGAIDPAAASYRVTVISH